MHTDTDILADLGGTRLRLARRGQAGLEDIRSYEPSAWPTLQAALTDYAPDLNGARLFMSFAKKVNADGVYHLDQPHKQAAWSFTIDDIKRETGLADMHVLHDMQAMGRAVFHADAFSRIGTGNAQTGGGLRCIINVGTGLGHAFINPVDQTVHDTFGGHFPPFAVTHEQREALSLLQEASLADRSFIWEEIVSGRGYAALGEQTGSGVRLFCEFLGLYAHTLAVSGHAFDGIYLCGGVIEGLFRDKAFDEPAYRDNFILRHVPIVDDALRACPVYRPNLPHTALYGLDVYAQSLSDN